MFFDDEATNMPASDDAVETTVETPEEGTEAEAPAEEAQAEM